MTANEKLFAVIGTPESPSKASITEIREILGVGKWGRSFRSSFARPTAMNEEGRTAAGLAAEVERYDTLRTLVELDPSVINQRDRDGRTPLFYANTSKMTDFLIKELGANDKVMDDQYMTHREFKEEQSVTQRISQMDERIVKIKRTLNGVIKAGHAEAWSRQDLEKLQRDREQLASGQERRAAQRKSRNENSDADRRSNLFASSKVTEVRRAKKEKPGIIFGRNPEPVL